MPNAKALEFPRTMTLKQWLAPHEVIYQNYVSPIYHCAGHCGSVVDAPDAFCVSCIREASA